MQQKFFLTPWAATGDRTTPPDAQQPDGSVSFAVGFGPDYEADPATDPNAKPVPREETNGLYYELTNAIGALQGAGFPEFITAADNGGTAYAYARGAPVRWSATGSAPFNVYVSRVNNNTALPSNATNWGPLVFEEATNAQAIAGAPGGLIITPPALQAALAAATVSVPDASTTVKGIQRNATNAEAVAGALTTATVTPAGLTAAVASMVPAASTTVAGRIEIGTLAEQAAGTSSALAVTPQGLQAGLGTKAAVDATWDASAIATGVLPIERGGTGAGALTANRYLKGNGTGPILGLTPTQVLADIGGASLASNVFSDFQEIRSDAATSLVYAIADAAGNRVASFSGTSTVSALAFDGASGGGTVVLRPNGRASSAGQTSVAKNGNMAVAGSVTASGGFQGSSRTVKTDDAPCPYGLDEVLRMTPRSFRYLPEYRDDGGVRSVGMYAEDLRAIIPEMVRESDGPSPLVVEFDQLFPVLVRAFQELHDRIEDLEARQ